MSDVVVRLNAHEVMARLNVSRTTLWRMCKSGELGPPRYMRFKRVWLLSDIEAWEAEHAHQSSPHPTAANLSKPPKGVVPPQFKRRVGGAK